MSPQLHDFVAVLVRQYLAANNEDACWLAGEFGREWNSAYFRILSQVCHSMQKALDWREFNRLRPEIIEAVRRNVRKGPCSDSSNH